jgi:hypothetical protein
MDFLENVAQREAVLTEVEMKQENNHEFIAKEPHHTELKYEDNQTIKEEEEDFDEVGNGYEFLETVLVEVKEEHEQEIQYSSDHCEFTSKHDMYQNKRSEHQGINLKCEKCSYVAKIPSKLKLHVESVHEGVKCEDCEISATTIPNLKTHRNSQHLNIKKEYSCKFCDFKTASHCALSTHKIAQHMTDEQKKKSMKKCNFCDFTTLTLSYLKKHIQSIHEIL